MRELPGWRDFAVVQRRDASGCIPAGYETLIRAAAVPGVDLDSFQDDFDLDKDRGPTDPARNNFESVAEAVRARYPQVQFRRIAFPQGRGIDKLALIESCLAAQRPVLVSLSLEGAGWGRGWHIMLAIGESDDEVVLLNNMLPDKKGLVFRVPKEELVRIHDNFPGGDDVAILDTVASV